ncbi:MAG: scyllo-inositol 2-dehydrogenase [Thermoleophilaceae bacterium]|nr:scyllo-inositol 2-dehydrogenase [Thermoleophilaceae bacterium]
MSADPARVGIVGFGLAGRVFHAPLVEAVDGLELAAIVTSDHERQERARAAHPGARVVASVDELWADVDLVVAATPNRTHVPLALAAIERGLAVVVDKPLAPSVADAERLLAAGGRLTVFQNRRFDGDFLTVARLVSEGDLGRVTRFESRFERFRPEVSGDTWREQPDAEEGGGLLLDLGAHLVDQACQLFGPPVEVYGEVDTRRPDARVEDDVFVALEHRGGERSHLWMSSTAPLNGPRFRVSGLRAGFETFGLDPQEAQLADGLRPGDPDYGRASPGRLVDAGGARELPLEPGAYERFYEGVARWLGDDAPAPVDPADSLAGLRVLEAVRRRAAAAS